MAVLCGALELFEQLFHDGIDRASALFPDNESPEQDDDPLASPPPPHVVSDRPERAAA